MSIEINILFYLQRHKGIDISWQECQPIVRMKRGHRSKFVRISAALETEGFEYTEWCVCRQTVYIHDTGLLNDMVGIVSLVDRNCNTVWSIGKLCNGIYDQAIILLPSLEVTT